MTTASIVIVTYGQRALTEQCLDSLQQALGDGLGRDWELVLVDNDSRDDTRKLLEQWSDRARVILLNENRNFSGGCNVGATVARGEVLVFLNNDTEVPPGALEALVEQAREPEVGAVGCRLLFPNRLVQHAGVAFISGKGLNRTPMPQHVLTRQSQTLAATQAVYEADCVTAACMTIPAELFRSVGGFDEGFRNGLEDVDLCLRIRMAGRKVIYRGDVTLIHHEGATRGSGKEMFQGADRIEAARHNDWLFATRWGQRLDEDNELAEQVWDATVVDPPETPERTPDLVDMSVIGSVSGIGPWADETRAFLDLWSRRGQRVAAYNRPFANLQARLSAEELSQIELALRRTGTSDRRSLYVPVASADEELSSTTTVRVGDPRAVSDITEVQEVWASCRTVAEAIIDAGFSPDLVSVVPPPLRGRTVGPGGGGVLVVLPVQDLRLSALVLEQLRAVKRRVEVTLLPTTYRRAMSVELAELLPHAALLASLSDEQRFAELAAQMDVVVAADPSDPFERRALVAESVGATALTLRPDGPAAEILGDRAVTAVSELADAIVGSLDSGPDERSARSTHTQERSQIETSIAV